MGAMMLVVAQIMSSTRALDRGVSNFNIFIGVLLLVSN
jgi:hypothetical protein